MVSIETVAGDDAAGAVGAIDAEGTVRQRVGAQLAKAAAVDAVAR
jgi:hypothetical protein